MSTDIGGDGFGDDTGVDAGDDTAGVVDWSQFGDGIDKLAADRGWESPAQAFAALREADVERGRLRNQLGDMRKQAEQREAEWEQAFENVVSQDFQPQGDQAGEWAQYAETFGLDDTEMRERRWLLEQGIPALVQQEIQQAREQMMAEFGQQISPIQQYVGAESLKSEAANIQRQYPGALQQVQDQVVQMMERPEYRRPGGMTAAFKEAWADHTLSAASHGKPITYQPQNAGPEADIYGGGARGQGQASQDYAQSVIDAIENVKLNPGDGF